MKYSTKSINLNLILVENPTLLLMITTGSHILTDSIHNKVIKDAQVKPESDPTGAGLDLAKDDKKNILNFYENKGSAQCKSAVMLAALNTYGETIIKAKKSRNHTELLFKYLKL